MAVSYRPAIVPSGPVTRCISSWRMRSGGRSRVDRHGPGRRVVAERLVRVALLPVRPVRSVEVGIADTRGARSATSTRPNRVETAPFHGSWANLSIVAMTNDGQQPVDLLVDGDDGDALAGACRARERALRWSPQNTRNRARPAS